MKIEATDRAASIVEAVRGRRSGELVVTIGSGCCESTAPFLYEDHDPGADAIRVGEVAGVPIFASPWLVNLYPNDALLLDGETDVITETFSIEAEIDARLLLALPKGGTIAESEACAR